jgi:hypothetical protein
MCIISLLPKSGDQTLQQSGDDILPATVMGHHTPESAQLLMVKVEPDISYRALRGGVSTLAPGV